MIDINGLKNTHSNAVHVLFKDIRPCDHFICKRELTLIMLLVADVAIQNDAKPRKMTETLSHGYSSEEYSAKAIQ